jgi:putative transposase
MPKSITIPITNESYHVFNRGVDKREIFIDKLDYLRFYQILDLFNSLEPIVNYNQAKHTHAEKKLVEIQAYSLLSNHFHLILKQLVDGGISEFMKRVGVTP